MPRVKAILIDFLKQFSNAFPLGSLVQWSGRTLFCPFYHTVSETPLPHIRHLYQTKTPQQFRADIEYLLKHFEPLSFDDIYAGVENKVKRSKPGFFLSFDDGLKEVYEVVAPILYEKGIPAMIFLNSAFVDNRGLMFRYKASLIIEKLEGLHKEKVRALADFLKTAPTIKEVRAAILKIDYFDQAILNQLAVLAETDFLGFLDQQQPYLTSEQIKEMGDSGLITFGAHSVDHPLFKNLTQAEQLEQSQTSLEWLQRQEYPSRKAFAFPFTDDGVKSEFFETMFNDYGLKLSFGSAGIKRSEFGERHVQRFPMEGTALPADQLVSTEYVYFLIKRIVGKDKVAR